MLLCYLMHYVHIYGCVRTFQTNPQLSATGQMISLTMETAYFCEMSVHIYIYIYIYIHHTTRRYIPQVNNRHCHFLQSFWWHSYPLFSDNNLNFRFRYSGMRFLTFGGARHPLQSIAFFFRNVGKRRTTQRHTQEERNPQLHPWRSVTVGVKLCFWRNIQYMSVNNNNNNNNNIFNCKWAAARWQWVLCMYINMKWGSKKFKSGGLHEKNAVATWSLRNHLSICF